MVDRLIRLMFRMLKRQRDTGAKIRALEERLRTYHLKAEALRDAVSETVEDIYDQLDAGKVVQHG